eukprot:RCo039068
MAAEALNASIRALLSAIEAQPEFASQHNVRRGSVFYMWEFVSNTLRMLESEESDREAKSDVVARSMFAKILFHDPSTLCQVTGDAPTRFSTEVMNKAEEVEARAGVWGVAEGLLRP